MDDWEEFSETSLTQKRRFLQLSNMEDITYADYVHPKRLC